MSLGLREGLIDPGAERCYMTCVVTANREIGMCSLADDSIDPASASSSASHGESGH